ncbi:hypothetical protein [Mesorhizobium sp. INR15]|uniref:hypothetical protein n=1 Tax=Mesorhizobium sp. INR15 TaxID=2654248 RepID=UPI001896774A|nr:hypothetical protein [Mesorhizobium sp. INR15]QPC92089.1 hypothetical protein GA829_16735 [Mesorhizobium sp. INR15]
MVNWKGAGVAAVAIVSFVLVKALPWTLGLAGGKYLYETAMGTPAATPRTLTTAQVSDQLLSQEFKIFLAIKQEFPEDYDEIVQKITAVARAEGSVNQVREVSRTAVADLRHKYASVLPSTPDSDASEALRAQLDMLNHVMARESPTTCNGYLKNGPGALSAPAHEQMMDMDAIGATLIRAYGAARRSGLAAAPASDEDWSMAASAFVAAGGTQADMEAIGTANQAYEGLCPALSKFYAAALSMRGEPGRHVKTALLYEIARN